MNNETDIFNNYFILKFIINMISLLLLLRFIYYRNSPNRDSLFGFFLFGNGVFLVTALLHNVEMSMGFAFGLFAVFSMLRYRTESISIRDMTYLFIVIVMALMSAVGPVSTIELAALNLVICFLAAISETSILAPKICEKKIVYEKVELAKPGRYNELMLDICHRTGLEVIKAEVLNINFLQDTANIRIFYKENPVATQVPISNDKDTSSAKPGEL